MTFCIFESRIGCKVKDDINCTTFVVVVVH